MYTSSFWRTRLGGFSLIEVLVAMGVMAVGILALMAVFITGTRSNQHGAELSRATYYARKIAEIIREDGLAFSTGTIPPNAASGLNNPVGTFVPLTAAPPANVFLNIRLPLLNDDGTARVDGTGNPVLDPGDNRYERSIQITRASNTATDYNFSILVMDVTVRWQGGKAGDGMRRVSLRTLLKSN